MPKVARIVCKNVVWLKAVLIVCRNVAWLKAVLIACRNVAWLRAVLIACKNVVWLKVVPMMALAALWHRLDGRSRSLLRGRGFTALGRRLHTTSVLTGLLIIALGILFWTTNGLVTLPSLVPTSALANWQERSVALAALVGAGALVYGAATLILGAFKLSDLKLFFRRGRVEPAGE